MKSIVIGIIIVMIVFTPLMVFAEEEDMAVMEINDSLKISTEIKQLLNVQDSENVFRIYNLSIRSAFSEIHNIDELLETEGLILSEYYAVQANDGVIRYKGLIGMDPVELSGEGGINEIAWKAFQDKSIVTKISSDINVYETYYLSGETTYTGSAVYYKTNKGDFVYYNHYAVGSSEYLFPIEDFCEYQKMISNEIAKHPDWDGGVDISRLMDLSKYDIHSPDFNLTANMQQIENIEVNPPQSDPPKNIVVWGCILIGVILLLISGVFSYTYIHKRKDA